MRNRPSGDQSQGILTSGDSKSTSSAPSPVDGFTDSATEPERTDSNAIRPPSGDQTGRRAILPSDPRVKRVWRVESSSHRSVSFWSERSAATRRPSGDSLRFDSPACSGDPSVPSALPDRSNHESRVTDGRPAR